MNMELLEKYEDNLKYIQGVFNGCDDIVFKQFSAAGKECFIVYTDNIVDGTAIEDMILTNLMFRFQGGDGKSVEKRGIAIGEVKESSKMQDVLDAVLLGDTAVFVNGYGKAFIASTKGWPSRGVPQADTEMTVYGPKDAFCEVGSINTVLIRRRIRDTALKVKRMKCGRRSKTDIAVMYIDGIARENVVDEVLESLEKIDVDMIIDSGYLQQFMEGSSKSPSGEIQTQCRPCAPRYAVRA